MDEIVIKLRELEERADQLREFEEACENALQYILEAESLCPDGIIFSGHAEMEMDENLGEVQELIEELKKKVESIA